MLRARHIAVKGRNAHWFSWLYRTKFCVIKELSSVDHFRRKKGIFGISEKGMQVFFLFTFYPKIKSDEM